MPGESKRSLASPSVEFPLGPVLMLGLVVLVVIWLRGRKASLSQEDLDLLQAFPQEQSYEE